MEQDVKTTPLMERVKLQTEVLLPLLHQLRTELGAEKANSLVYPVLRRITKDWVKDIAKSESTDPIENFRKTSELHLTYFEGDVDMEVLQADDERLEVNVTGCRYADFFRQLGEPELGAILTCEMDDHIAKLSAPAVSLSLTDTIMKGATHCPFRYKFAEPKMENDCTWHITDSPTIRPGSPVSGAQQTSDCQLPAISHSFSFDQRRRPDTFLTAIATAFF